MSSVCVNVWPMVDLVHLVPMMVVGWAHFVPMVDLAHFVPMLVVVLAH